MLKMIKINKLINENNGYNTTKIINENNIARFYLTKMVKEKKIEKVSQGLYIDPTYFICEFYKFQFLSIKCIYSL